MSPEPIRSRVFALAAVSFVMLMASVAHADTPTFAAASRALAEGHCADAASRFEALTQQRGWSAPSLDGLGKSYACAGKLGLAVLSYERARVLAPRDEAARAGLVAARHSMRAAPWYRRAAEMLSLSTWTWLGMGSFWLGLGTLLLTNARRRWWIASSVAASVITALSFGAVGLLHGALSDGIVVASGATPVRISPFDTAEIETQAGEGERLRLLERDRGFLHVRDAEGESGWISGAAVEPIVPRRS